MKSALRILLCFIFKGQDCAYQRPEKQELSRMFLEGRKREQWLTITSLLYDCFIDSESTHFFAKSLTKGS